jgi:hypothetical protein
LKYRVPAPLRPSKKRYLAAVIPDVHLGYHQRVPSHDPLVWDVGMQALAHLADRLTHVIVIGDFGNWEALSHWAALRAQQVYIAEDVAIVNHGLDELDMICDPYGIKKVFIEGNHELWAMLLEAKYPILRDQINLRRVLLGGRQRWTWVPNNHFYKLGKLYLTHGNIRGVKTPQDMIKKTGKSVVYGHTHGNETQSIRCLDGEHSAWTCGCWASIEPPPPYAKAWVPEKWVHGLTLAQIRANGIFQVNFRRIIDSSYMELFDGTEIIADRKRAQARVDGHMRLLDNLELEYRDRYYHPSGRVKEDDPVEPLRGTEQRTRGYRARVIANRG